MHYKLPSDTQVPGVPLTVHTHNLGLATNGSQYSIPPNPSTYSLSDAIWLILAIMTSGQLILYYQLSSLKSELAATPVAIYTLPALVSQ